LGNFHRDAFEQWTTADASALRKHVIVFTKKKVRAVLTDAKHYRVRGHYQSSHIFCRSISRNYTLRSDRGVAETLISDDNSRNEETKRHRQVFVVLTRTFRWIFFVLLISLR
jgi:hypothetical protein